MAGFEIEKKLTLGCIAALPHTQKRVPNYSRVANSMRINVRFVDYISQIVVFEVREIVLTGPYRYIRHPMYLGEVVMVAGLVMTILSPFSIALLGALILFQYLRACMEQSRLSMASPEYAEHMKKSGMFFPKRSMGLPGLPHSS